MADTLGGGLGTAGATKLLCNMYKRGQLSNELVEEGLKYCRNILTNPEKNGADIKWAAEFARLVDSKVLDVAVKMAEHERIDAGKATSAEKITVRITFDDAG